MLYVTLGDRSDAPMRKYAQDLDAHGQLWIVEHGTKGGDELNRIEKGGNYGWPLQAYGQEYSGQPIPNATTQPKGMEQPVY